MSKKRDWTLLPVNVVYIIATVILEADVVDYNSFRSTCHDWRSVSQDITQDLSEMCFHLRRWIMLSDVDGSPTEPKRFVNIMTGKILRIKVPELKNENKFLTTADGLLIIGRDTRTKVLNPFTRSCINLPSLPLRVDQRVTGAAVTSTCNVILCMINHDGVPIERGTVWYAARNYRRWKTLQDSTFLSNNTCFRNTLLFRDILYTVHGTGVIKGLNLNAQPAVKNIIAPTFDSNLFSFFLVESKGQMLLLRKVKIDGSQNVSFEIFKVDLTHKSLIPISTIGDQALFISDERTLSISAAGFPFVEKNSTYFVRHIELIKKTYRMGCVYNLTGETVRNLHLFRNLHNLIYWWGCSDSDKMQWKDRRILIRPYSLIDHILCYCYQRAWCMGSMFHELSERK